MSFFKKLFSGDLFGSINKIIDNVHTSEEEKQEIKLRLTKLMNEKESEIEKTFRKEIDAKSQIIISELNQGDKYTKRARPTIIYAGLLISVINYCLIPNIKIMFGLDIVSIDVPSEFWTVWAAVASIWSVGRTAEKIKKINP